MLRVVFVLILAVFLSGCERQDLYSNLKQREANEMLAVLERAGIQASLQPSSTAGRVALSVSPNDAAMASSVLNRVGLPRPETTPLSEVLPQDTWMASRNQENARLAYGLGQDLSSTITQINGVRDARVHVALAQKSAIGQVETQPSASVLVRYDADILDPQLRHDIATLISNAVPGLNYERVSVTMVPDGANLAVAMAGRMDQGTSAGTSSLQTWIQVFALIALASLLVWLGYTRFARRSA
ncbi:MAG: type III secretion inner membrane ring lipoprotein SctJ [Pseudomonadota bacterium]